MAIENRYFLNPTVEAPIFHRSARSTGLKGSSGKKSLRWPHLLVIFLSLVLFFLGVAQVYYHVITCEELRIKRVEVTSSSPELQQQVENFLLSRNLGNILICNLDYLRLKLQALSGVKEARLEKILPSTLRVEVFPRTPQIYVRRGLYFLVDEEGQVLSQTTEVENSSYPVLEDEDYFNSSYQEKVRLACQALSGVEPGVSPLIRRLFFKKDLRLEVELVGDPVRLILSPENFAEQLNYYLANREAWAQTLGPLEYVDLRIEGRAYVKPLELAAGNSSGVKKEVS